MVTRLFVVYHAGVSRSSLLPELTSPPNLAPGSRIAVVAPASPFPDLAFFSGLATLQQRYEISARVDVRARAGYLAGDDARRSVELSAAMRDPSIRAIFCARGGYGATRITTDLPWDEFARAPKWIVGFSDVTALHVEASAHGVASIHAPNVTGLSTKTLPLVRYDLLCALEGHSRERESACFQGLSCVHRGSGVPKFVDGISFGGNLALVCAMAAAGRLRVPRGAIFFLEDVTERPYRVDRMLTSLLVGGYFSECGAIVFGGFTECDAGPDGITVDDVLAERTRDLGIPVVSGAPFGHGPINRPIVFGRRCRVTSDRVEFFAPAA